MKKLDYKQEAKELYLPPKEPSTVDVPAMTMIMIDGHGDPNEENGAYQNALALLYALTFTIKMSKMGGHAPDGYFEYVVPPLEGLWWTGSGGLPDFRNKADYRWTSMIRQPDFVTPAVFEWARGEVGRKKHLDASAARLEMFAEGRCVQMMHVGPYDGEPASMEKIGEFLRKNGLRDAVGTAYADGRVKRHHEIYLSDPRRTAPEKLRTVLRHPVTAADGARI